MKYKIEIFLFLFIVFGLTAQNLYTVNVDDFFPENFEINELYEPYISRQFNGKSFIFSYWKEIEFNNKMITMRIIQKFSTDIIPYKDRGLHLLRSIYSDNDDFDQLFPSDEKYFDDRNVDYSFIYDYVAKGPRYISDYEPDIIIGMDGTVIERDFAFGIWFYSSTMNQLTYYFTEETGLFSEYVIEFSNVWSKFNEEHDPSLLTPKLQKFQPPDGGEFIDVLYTLTNEELDAYPDQSDPSIRLMRLLNGAMENFRFSDRPNEPPAPMAVVNNSLVRLRSEPNLSGDVLGYVDRDEEVVVLEQSPGEQTIGTQTARWYKIVSKTSFLKGWMFGSYLDFE